MEINAFWMKKMSAIKLKIQNYIDEMTFQYHTISPKIIAEMLTQIKQ